MLSAAGCGAGAQHGASGIERTFDVTWHDHASASNVAYVARHIVLHDGRWSAELSIRNDTGKPLYPIPWAPADTYGAQWYGPALVYSGHNVLNAQQLIYVPAKRATPALPFPLRAGATWHGVVTGTIPTDPALPKGTTIWVRYPVFAIGTTWDPTMSSALRVDWISQKGFKL